LSFWLGHRFLHCKIFGGKTGVKFFSKKKKKKKPFFPPKNRGPFFPGAFFKKKKKKLFFFFPFSKPKIGFLYFLGGVFGGAEFNPSWGKLLGEKKKRGLKFFLFFFGGARFLFF